MAEGRFGVDFELSPQPGEPGWGEESGDDLALPEDSAAAASEDYEAQPAGDNLGDEYGFLSEDEAASLDPDNPVHARIIEELRQARTQPAANLDLDEDPQTAAVEELPGIEFGYRPDDEWPEELEPYKEPIFSSIEKYVSKLYGDVEQRAAEVTRREQAMAVQTRLSTESRELASGPHGKEFMADREDILRMAQTDAGKTLLADPNFGLKGLVNAVRAKKGKGPLTFGGARPGSTPTSAPRMHPRRLEQARASAVEQTPPSVDSSRTAAPSQVPVANMSTGQLVKQAWNEAKSEARQGRR